MGDKRKIVHETTKPSGVNMSSASYRTQAPQAQHLAASSRVNRTPHSASSAQSSSSSQEAGNSGSTATSTRMVNPFVSNPHGHPSFNPVKLGAKGSGDSKTPKQPKPPDKPLMPYLRYSRKVWDSVKASNPDLKLWEIGKIIGQMWRELSEEEKQEFVDEYEMEKIQYADAMKAYHNSPAYQTWIAAKGKADVMTEPEEPEKTRKSKAPASHQAEPKIVNIQQPDDEDDLDDTPSVKHIAASRYHRNHCLINDIFSDAIVPDGRTVINESRMTVLKRQVQSLTVHQKKLEGELQQLEEKHKAKKCKFAESSEEFYQEYRKLCECKPQITDEQFAAMVQQAKDEQREQQKNAATPKEQDVLSLTQSDQRQSVDEKQPLKEEEHENMEDSETVLLTKPPSLDRDCTAADDLTDKQREDETEAASESQLSTDLKKQNDCPLDQDTIPEKMETDPAPAPESAMSWKERLTAEADSAAILSDITEDSVDGTSTDDSSKKAQ